MAKVYPPTGCSDAVTPGGRALGLLVKPALPALPRPPENAVPPTRAGSPGSCRRSPCGASIYLKVVVPRGNFPLRPFEEALWRRHAGLTSGIQPRHQPGKFGLETIKAG